MQNVTFPLPYRGGDTLANGYISTQILIKKACSCVEQAFLISSRAV